MAKLALTFVAVFLLCQLATWGTADPRVRRDEGTTEKNVLEDIQKTLNEALGNVKTQLSNTATEIQESDIFKNITQSLHTFGEKVKTAGKQLVDNLQEKPAAAA